VIDPKFQWQRYSKNPIVIGGGPEIVFKDEKFFLYYWQPARTGSGFEIHLWKRSMGFIICGTKVMVEELLDQSRRELICRVENRRWEWQR